jgi:hypothetical protein
VPNTSSYNIFFVNQPLYVYRPRSKSSKQIFPGMKLHTCICKQFIHIFPRSVSLFCCIAFADRSGECINRSQVHECRFVNKAAQFLFWEYSNFRYSAFAVCDGLKCKASREKLGISHSSEKKYVRFSSL